MNPSGSTTRPKPRACLVLHGLGGGPYEVGPLIEAIEARGLIAEAPVYPGPGGAGPHMPRSAWPEWFEMSCDRFDHLQSQHGAVAVIGFSTGGTLALHLSAARPVDRQVLLAPFLAIRHRWYYGLRPEFYLTTIGRFIGRIRRRRAAVSDHGLQEEIERLITFRTFNLEAACSALELIRLVRAEVPRLRLPTLIVQSRRDSIVDPVGAQWLDSHLGTSRSDRQLVWLDRSDHLLAIDVEREFVIRRVLEFLETPSTSRETPSRSTAGHELPLDTDPT